MVLTRLFAGADELARQIANEGTEMNSLWRSSKQ